MEQLPDNLPENLPESGLHGFLTDALNSFSPTPLLPGCTFGGSLGGSLVGSPLRRLHVRHLPPQGLEKLRYY
jgi:hypothetical protein